ncbi:hypothetical protein H0O00_02145 [Candidatus Micrarchaeota archaeon]|nr:hypothetical protein [Candidatus Micrarchaeota archaeon]
MAGALARREIVVPKAPVLAMVNRFSRYKPEEEKAVRKVEVVEDETLKRLKAAFGELEFNHSSDETEEYYVRAHDTARQLRYSSKDIELFSITLAGLLDENELELRAGLFLSALINNGKDGSYVIHTNGILIDDLGYKNTKHITVEGDVGECIGWRMERGSITVNGNVGTFCGGMMDSGVITVNGDTGGWVGSDMEGGTITVKGDAGKLLGGGMKGGEIHIEGEIGHMSDVILGGKIFHKGKIIVDK